MSQSSANLVEVRGIRFSRGDRVIFDDISLSVPRGKITAIMGPSGIGKTTLLRLIGGQIPCHRALSTRWTCCSPPNWPCDTHQSVESASSGDHS